MRLLAIRATYNMASYLCDERRRGWMMGRTSLYAREDMDLAWPFISHSIHIDWVETRKLSMV